MCLSQKKKEKNAYLSHFPKGKTTFLIASPSPNLLLKNYTKLFFKLTTFLTLAKKKKKKKKTLKHYFKN
jgi:hypothetical protein